MNLKYFFWSLYFKTSKILRLNTVSSYYGVKLKSNFSDKTFKFYVKGRYGNSYWNKLKAIKEPFIYIDIGANQGLYTIGAALNKNLIRAYAFEPIKNTSQILHKNTKLNNVEDKVEIIAKAISNSKSTQAIDFDSNHSGTATLEVQNSAKPDQSKSITIETINHDDLNSLINFDHKPIYVKIDVEGHEKTVLNEILETDFQSRIQEIFFEVDERWVNSGQLFELLTQRGFQLTKFGAGPHYDMCATRNQNAKNT